VEPFTYLERAFDRSTGVSPFKIPDSWMKIKSQLDMRTPFCISTNNDIVGREFRQPVDRRAGSHPSASCSTRNIHSISGDYWFDAARTGRSPFTRPSSAKPLARCTGQRHCLTRK